MTARRVFVQSAKGGRLHSRRANFPWPRCGANAEQWVEHSYTPDEYVIELERWGICTRCDGLQESYFNVKYAGSGHWTFWEVS